MRSIITFIQDGKLHQLELGNGTSAYSPTTTVLNYLRSLPDRKGTKEGCAEGDCGACTVVLGELAPGGGIRYRAVDSCLLFLPMLHGKQLITVEDVQSRDGELHPVQQAMVETGGSQCGFCTPGFVMSLFALYKESHRPSREEIDDALTGNLCRCTGYRPIIEAAGRACVHEGIDQFSAREPAIAALLQEIPQDSLELQAADQHYWKPASLADALGLVCHHPHALVLSGATDIALRVTKRHEVLKEIIDISDVRELKAITETAGELLIGAGVPLNDIMPHVEKPFPALHDMLSVFGSRQIRMLATLGGNLGTASPIGDTLPVLMAYRARIVLESLGSKRDIPVDEFITGYRTTVRKPDELITGILLPTSANSALVRSYKVSKRKDLDISTVSSGFRLEKNDLGEITSVILAYGGMAGRTKRAATAEQFLLGKRWERTVVEAAMSRIDTDFTPISDARASAAMRTLAARNLLLKFWADTHKENGRHE